MINTTFQWSEPAETVIVTGSFDNWSQSLKAEKTGSVFVASIALPAGEKVYYKYVVDGVWTCGNEDNTETDENGNLNCVLNVPEKSNTVKTFVLPSSSPVSAKQTSPKKSIFGSLKKKPTSDKVVEDKVDVIEPVVEPPSPEKSETHATLAIEEESKPSIDKKAKRQSIFARTMTKKDRAEFEASLEGIRREEIKSEQQQAEEKPNDEEHLVQKKKSFWRKLFSNPN